MGMNAESLCSSICKINYLAAIRTFKATEVNPGTQKHASSVGQVVNYKAWMALGSGIRISRQHEGAWFKKL